MFDNPFDKYKMDVFDTVAKTMGYLATWGGETAQVLFKEPTEKQKLFAADFDPNAYTIEYKKGVFAGLKQSVDEKNEEVVTIRDNEYNVQTVTQKFDGEIFEAKLYLIQ